MWNGGLMQNFRIVHNSKPGGYIKRTSMGGIKFILTSFFEEREGGEWTHICRFYFYELMVCVPLNCLCGENVKILILNF